MFLNHYLAQAGICSRRNAVQLIKGGLITVNGAIVKEPGYEVQPNDSIKYKKQLIKLEEKIYILLNKPANYISTTFDDLNRKTIIDLIPHARKNRLFPIGRLDKDTTGLIVLTNDGKVAQKLSHPSYEIKKVYQVTLDKPLLYEDLKKIKDGIRLYDGIARVDTAMFPDPKNKKIIRLGLHSGKKHIIRRIAKALENKVRKLDRINYADLTKKGLRVGDYRSLTKEEIHALKGCC